MSSNLGTMYVKLDLDSSGFDKGIQQAQSTAQKGGNFLSNALSFATGGAILGGLKAIGGGILGVANSMVTGNAEFERYQTQFGVLLGSTEAAKQRLDELAKFGASTPFELPQLVQADKVLQSFGIHSQEMLTIVGDVAAGTGASFQDMALLMGKFSAGATGEVISRFAELGIASRAELANLGLEFSKSGELLTPLPQAMQVVQDLMKDKFGGMMQAQSQTFEGMMSNLQDWVGSTLRTVGQPIFEVLKDKLQVVLEFLGSSEVQSAITTFATALATGIGATITFIGNDVIPTFLAIWNTISPAIQTIIPVIQNIIAAFQANGTSFNELGGIWQKVSSIITLAAQLVEKIVPPIFAGIASFLDNHGDTIFAILSNTWNSIKSAINIVLTLIEGIIRTTIQIIDGDWSGAWNTIKEMSATIVTELWNIIKNGFNNILLVFGTSVDDIVNTFNSLPDRMYSIGANIIDGIIDGVNNAAGRLYGRLEDIATDALNAAKEALGIQSPSLRANEEIGQPFIIGILEGMEAALPQMLQYTSELGDKMIDKIRGAANAVSSILEGAFSGEADIYRQQESNLQRLSRFGSQVQASAGTALQTALQEANKFTNPKDAAEYYRLRSKQIIEAAELQDQLLNASTDEERDALEERLSLLNAAHTAELKAFDERQKRSQTALQNLRKQIQEILDSITLTGDDNGTFANRLYELLVALTGLTGVPAFASGVRNFGGGLALVGEQGPELVTLPRGSSVYSAPQTRSISNVFNQTLNVSQAGSLVDEMHMMLAMHSAL